MQLLRCFSTSTLSLIIAGSLTVLLKGNVVEGCAVTPYKAYLGVDPRDAFGSQVFVDVYMPCPKQKSKKGGKRKQHNQPLVILACGGGVETEEYSMFATGMALKNHVVLVLDHPVSFAPGGPSLNFAAPFDFGNAIVYAGSQNIDTTKVIILGHSYGSAIAVQALSEFCEFPNCVGPPGATTFVPLPSRVEAALSFGFALVDRRAGPDASTNSFVDDFNNNGFPYFILNGSGDTNTFLIEPNTGETYFEGTFARLNATKVMLEVDNLDHYSINNNWLPDDDRSDIPSTLPREEQVAMVVDIMATWIKRELDPRANNNFCNEIERRGMKKGKKGSRFIAANCLEEYAV